MSYVAIMVYMEGCSVGAATLGKAFNYIGVMVLCAFYYTAAERWVAIMYNVCIFVCVDGDCADAVLMELQCYILIVCLIIVHSIRVS